MRVILSISPLQQSFRPLRLRPPKQFPRRPISHTAVTSEAQQEISDESYNCYGCGIPVQVRAPSAPGYVDAELLAVKMKHRHRSQLLCGRCQGLSNGAMLPGVRDFAQRGYDDDASLMTPDELRSSLEGVKDIPALIVLLVDLLDVSGSLLGKIRDIVGRNPIILVGTKADLLPTGCDSYSVEEWLASSASFKRLTVCGVYLVSSKTGEGMAAAIAAVRKERRGRDTFIMGAANVGKSAFIRSLVKDMADATSRQFDPAAISRRKRLPVESSMPGTTLGLIPMPVFAAGGMLYDTPGLHLHHRLPHMLTPDENKVLHPRKKLRPYIPPCQPGNEGRGVYEWGGIAKIELSGCPENTTVVFYGPSALKVQTPAAEGGEDVEVFGKESVKLRGGVVPAKMIDIRIPKGQRQAAVVDITLSGLPGWMTIYASSIHSGDRITVTVWAPIGIEVFQRPPIPVPWPFV